ncbi:trypsin-like serine protease [Jidongwangia harbinensis]|uniref:trypsin-like serine protease n=1 Tax=Jidongwangia harbinensis TaxID=2878561 RepID=UPI001CD953FC|nr:trypsin-like serine protease [Jidongwangia harbinensis]MCA2219193.1 trypsin-like serine protease [Jidongwangia harbinensis]
MAALAALAVGLAGLTAADQALAVAGGSQPADAAYGYVVKVGVGSDRSCTGVLVDPHLVATSKECFKVGSAAPVTGPPPVTGTVTTRSDQVSGAQTVAISYLHVRDDRNLVLAHLARGLTALRGNAPVSAAAPVAGETLRVLGFGRTADEWVPALPHTGQVSLRDVSATGIGVTTVGDSAVCKGDAGGPVIRENSDGTANLVAVLSTSGQGGCLGETSTSRDATATRVDGLAEWIDQFKEFELTGVVEVGVGSGCLVVKDGTTTYQLAGGSASVVKAGETVHIFGYRAPNPAGACTAGVRIQVTQAYPVATLVGTVTRAAEGCALLASGGVTYRPVGGDPAVVKVGAKLSITGYVMESASACAQGTAFRVLSVVPATVVSLRARVNNKFVTAANAGADPLIANRDSVGGSWERFDAFDLGRGIIALRANVNNKFVTAANAGDGALIANRDSVGGSWEKFQLVRNADGTVSLKAQVNGKYVTAANAGADPLIANRDTVGGSWEKFDLITN